MKKKHFDLSKHMPQHGAVKALAVLLASVWLIWLRGSLTHADLVIQSSLENVVQTIQSIHVTLDGTPNTPDRVRLDNDGVYIEPSILGGTSEWILKVGTNGYIMRDLIQSWDIASDSITGLHMTEDEQYPLRQGWHPDWGCWYQLYHLRHRNFRQLLQPWKNLLHGA